VTTRSSGGLYHSLAPPGLCHRRSPVARFNAKKLPSRISSAFLTCHVLGVAELVFLLVRVGPFPSVHDLRLGRAGVEHPIQEVRQQALADFGPILVAGCLLTECGPGQRAGHDDDARDRVSHTTSLLIGSLFRERRIWLPSAARRLRHPMPQFAGLRRKTL